MSYNVINVTAVSVHDVSVFPGRTEKRNCAADYIYSYWFVRFINKYEKASGVNSKMEGSNM